MQHQFEGREQRLGDGKLYRVMFCKLCGCTPGKKIGNVTITRYVTSECPGTKLTDQQRIAVMDENADFKAGQWIEK